MLEYILQYLIILKAGNRDPNQTTRILYEGPNLSLQSDQGPRMHDYLPFSKFINMYRKANRSYINVSPCNKWRNIRQIYPLNSIKGDKIC